MLRTIINKKSYRSKILHVLILSVPILITSMTNFVRLDVEFHTGWMQKYINKLIHMFRLRMFFALH